MTLYTGTAPTFTAGDTAGVTANLNILRDAVKAASEAWTPYTPTWTGATANPAIGDGTIAAAYARVGKLIHFRIVITMGATTTYGTGEWRLTLPVAPLSTGRQSFIADYYDTGINAWPGVATWFNANSALSLYAWPTTAGNPYRSVTSAVPFTWGAGDQVCVNGTYEAA